MLGPDGPTAARALIAAAIGIAGAIAVGLAAGWPYAPSAGWTMAALTYVAITWLAIGGMTPRRVAQHATREDPGRRMTDAIAVISSVASLAGVAYVLIGESSGGVDSDIAAVVGIASVAASWFLVHTVFTLRYAELYYVEPRGGIDFNQDEEPGYTDFAYLAFTLGMTYQVSDTDLQNRTVRATALRHALISYLLGAVVLATTINLIAGLRG